MRAGSTPLIESSYVKDENILAGSTKGLLLRQKSRLMHFLLVSVYFGRTSASLSR